MSIVKAAHSTNSVTQNYEFSAPVRDLPPEAVSKPIEAKTAVGVAPSQDQSLAKEDHFLDQIAALEKALSEKEKEITAAESAAYEEGFKAGKKAADSKSEEAIELLKASLSQSEKGLKESLNNQVEAGIAISRAILGNILGNRFEMPAHVVSAATHWKSELAAGSVLGLRVSADDFPDKGALDALSQEFPSVEIVSQSDLKSGACFFDLKLGSLDASIDRQLGSAIGFLDRAVQSPEQR
ncbi:hypothetical protein [uncultured Erythrobacter sp.]|uniref:FliH/SctL family protein n=1 Tax=uncultured Erythrobacter sp. TaxID=263913 RepID=UPI002639CA0A|nr:hypothetical protein [uncultured Erythrobacter sp.]